MTAQDMTRTARTGVPDDGIARWGGLAGIGGSALLLVVFAIVAVLVGEEPPGLAGAIERFPEVRAARTVENGLYLAVLVLWVPLALSLHHTLRCAHRAFALFGSALNVFGLAVLAAGAIPHAVTFRLSDLYHAEGATAEDQAALALLWQANQAMFNQLLLVGLLVMPVGVALLGLAMRRDPVYGRAAGTASVALGLIGLAAAVIMLVDPASMFSVVGVFALLAFHFLAGWKTSRHRGLPGVRD
jgi:hypothetical protein